MTEMHPEFDDFPMADYPALPEGFADSSWHNDVCPSADNDDLGLRVWIDYVDPAKRETVVFRDDGTVDPASIGKRYALVACGGPLGDFDTGSQTAIVETDDWAEVLQALAPKALMEWFANQADLSQSAANHLAGTRKGEQHQLDADHWQARADRVADDHPGEVDE